MSDTPNQNDGAIEIARERIRELADEIRGHQSCIDVANACRNELTDLIEKSSRKPRAPRKVRSAIELEIPLPDGSCPTVFATPCEGEAG